MTNREDSNVRLVATNQAVHNRDESVQSLIDLLRPRLVLYRSIDKSVDHLQLPDLSFLNGKLIGGKARIHLGNALVRFGNALVRLGNVPIRLRPPSLGGSLLLEDELDALLNVHFGSVAH